MTKGFGTLFIVILLGSAALGLALWVATSSLWSIRASIDNRSVAEARALVNACAENALEGLRENPSFTGSGNVTINSKTCTYVVTNLGGNNRQISVSGTVGQIMRNLRITTSTFNPLTISSWQEAI